MASADGRRDIDAERRVDAVLTEYGLHREGDVQRVHHGALNWNVRVETDRGALFVRRMHAAVTAERAAEEHALIAWARGRGIPAVEPLATTQGTTVVAGDDGLWAVFPWVEGATADRGHLSERQVRSLGEMHGRADGVLASHSSPRAAMPPIEWNAARGVAALAACRHVAIEQGAAEEVIGAMSRQAQLLEREPPSAAREFSWLPAQLVHGDFHDQQVIFDVNDDVIALTDWEMFRVAPRVRQLMRSLDFALLLAGDGLERYLEGYRRHVMLREDEARAAARFWRLDRLHSTWVWSAYFLEGNERAAEFLPRAVQNVSRVSDRAWWERLDRRFVRAALGRS